MKKKYTKKQIQESIRYWQKQLKRMNEDTMHQSPVTIEVHAVFLDVGTETDYAQKEYGTIQMKVDINKNIPAQIDDQYDKKVGTLPISYKFNTIDAVKCEDYDDLMREYNDYA